MARRVRLTVAIGTGGILGLFFACLPADEYACEKDLQCRQRDRSGLCTSGSCAYPDPVCDSRYRYSEHAAEDLAGQCVPPGEIEGRDSEGEPTGDLETEDATATMIDVCSDGCDTPPGPCFDAAGSCDAATDRCVYPPRPQGAACDDGDPCSMSDACDGAGDCVAGPPVVCNAPPSPCHQPVGTCGTDGCAYDFQPSGAPCEDGDACSVGDVCDEVGNCVAGGICPTTNPCESGSCNAGACDFVALANGTSCGPLAADRCCEGACVDISADPAHCGGCGHACGSIKSCQSVDTPAECDPSPASTSGRCTCDANTDCPHGQICRVGQPTANNLCAPENDADCDGVFVDVQLCPNYCTYP